MQVEGSSTCCGSTAAMPHVLSWVGALVTKLGDQSVQPRKGEGLKQYGSARRPPDTGRLTCREWWTGTSVQYVRHLEAAA